jgi:hypothetical protein
MKKSQADEDEERRRSWEHHLERWQGSGLSQAEYCRRHGLSAKTFGYHKRRIEKSPLCLVEVPLAAAVYTPPRPLRLTVGLRYTIEIEAGFDSDTLRRLLEVLER